jgi:hypothetical protein
MHGDGFLAQGPTIAGRDLDVFGKPVFNGVTAERRARLGYEKRFRWLTSALGEPSS